MEADRWDSAAITQAITEARARTFASIEDYQAAYRDLHELRGAVYWIQEYARGNIKRGGLPSEMIGRYQDVCTRFAVMFPQINRIAPLARRARGINGPVIRLGNVTMRTGVEALFDCVWDIYSPSGRLMILVQERLLGQVMKPGTSVLEDTPSAIDVRAFVRESRSIIVEEWEGPLSRYWKTVPHLDIPALNVWLAQEYEAIHNSVTIKAPKRKGRKRGPYRPKPLTKKQKRVVDLYYAHGGNCSAAAAAYDKTLQTYMSILYRADAKLVEQGLDSVFQDAREPKTLRAVRSVHLDQGPEGWERHLPSEDGNSAVDRRFRENAE
ncbi:MAG: hypothetical protein IT436_18960 [Phycisphaerales bacterium]|nr:hypothetical protein [Phycisphaerales bacterium]